MTAVEPKPGVDVGRVDVRLTAENYDDVVRREAGEIGPERVRRLEISALVDSGATYFCLPKRFVAQLGLRFLRTKETNTANGLTPMGIYSPVRVTVEGRDCISEVMELPDDCPPLLGQVPLEVMDWWIDPVNQRLVGNPRHGGQWMAELY